MLFGGSVEDLTESLEMFPGDESLGGVLPRCTKGADSGVSGPREPLVSEVDRSLAGDMLNSRRRDAPIDEARLGRVSSDLWVFESIKFWSRTIPENGTADNMLIGSSSLFTRGLCERLSL